MTTFASLDLIPPLQKALVSERYERPTPIQSQAIPVLLAGRDVLACAQTGTGKTAAFALPVLQRLAQETQAAGRARIRALVLTPTRELATQIGDSFAAYGKFLKLRHHVIFGGVGESPQIDALRRGVDILVATPGRLLDLMGRGFVELRHVEVFVLDEADRMLDMGFIHDVRRVMQMLPPVRQNLLFSATLPPAIIELAGTFLRNPARVEVAPPATTVETVAQAVMFVDQADKKLLLAELLQRTDVERAIVFTRTKHGANRLATQLERSNLRAVAIHGNKSQNARTRALEGFRSGEIPVLIATDLASRGIDVDGISHVFNYDLPNEPESYVHRIGRTARAGKSGVAISFCDTTEGVYLRDIERLIGMRLVVVQDQPYHCPAAMAARSSGVAPPAGRSGGGGRGGNRGGQGGRGGSGHGQGDRGGQRGRGGQGSGRGGQGGPAAQPGGRGGEASRSSGRVKVQGAEGATRSRETGGAGPSASPPSAEPTFRSLERMRADQGGAPRRPRRPRR